MERICYTFDLVAGMEEEYERRHAEVMGGVAQCSGRRRVAPAVSHKDQIGPLELPLM